MTDTSYYDLLDEVSPKGVLKEFNDEIRRKLRAQKD